jgi:hypothetical protein
VSIPLLRENRFLIPVYSGIWVNVNSEKLLHFISFDKSTVNPAAAAAAAGVSRVRELHK